MKRKYCKAVYERWNDAVDIDQAIATGDFTKKYYLDENTIGRIDYSFQQIGLIKVSYRLMEPPFEAILVQHFTDYPEGVSCEFVMPEVVNDEGLRVVTVYLYTSIAVLDFQAKQFLNEKGWVVRNIMIGADGQPESEEHPRYNANGDVIGRKVFDGMGKLLYEADYSEDD